jgi:hypothetical protein
MASAGQQWLSAAEVLEVRHGLLCAADPEAHKGLYWGHMGGAAVAAAAAAVCAGLLWFVVLEFGLKSMVASRAQCFGALAGWCCCSDTVCCTPACKQEFEFVIGVSPHAVPVTVWQLMMQSSSIANLAGAWD